ncbi:MAG: hypothetical protein ABJP48_06985 [Erythrobacter sp.]
MCEFDKTINDERIGPIRIGERLEAISPPLHLEEAYLPYSVEDGEMATNCDGEVEVIFDRGQDGKVSSLSTQSRHFETDKGASVGDTLEKILSSHPEGRLTSGAEEGGWIAYSPRGGKGYFEFSVEGLDHQCLQDFANCQVSKGSLESIRYWVTE